MPTVTIELPDNGGDAPRIEAAVAAALRDLTGATPRVTVRPTAPPPEGTVRAFLAAMEARDLDAARAHLAPDFTMTFPGGVVMHTPEELVAWSRPRYRAVAKTYDGFDTLGAVVWCHGRLHGTWPDGTTFAGIRFVDRFEVRDGLIHRQDVWNDMGEHRTSGA